MKRDYSDMDPKDFLTFIDPEYRAAIGQVIALWSMMEVLLESCIWQAAGVRNDIGRAITSQMQVQGKMDMLGAVLNQTKPAFGERVGKVADYVRDCLLGQRNNVVHGVWITPPVGAASITKFSARGRLMEVGGHITVDELTDLASDISEVSHWLMQLSSKLPALKQRRGGLGHKTRDTQTRLPCAKKKQLALQPLTSHRKAPRQSRKPGKRQARVPTP